MEVLITGAASGLGKCIAEEFERYGEKLFRVDLDSCDIRKSEEVRRLANSIPKLDILINNAGVNRIGSVDAFSEQDWDLVLDTNVKSIYLMSQAFLPQLRYSKGTIVNVVSNASRIPMTHSIAYNASKGAAAIMTRQMARELTRAYGITVFGINPNKLEKTGMSRYIENRVVELRGWSSEKARRYQLDALLTGFETKPEWIAELLVWLLVKKYRHQYLTGCLLDLGA